MEKLLLGHWLLPQRCLHPLLRRVRDKTLCGGRSFTNGSPRELCWPVELEKRPEKRWSSLSLTLYLLMCNASKDPLAATKLFPLPFFFFCMFLFSEILRFLQQRSLAIPSTIIWDFTQLLLLRSFWAFFFFFIIRSIVFLFLTLQFHFCGVYKSHNNLHFFFPWRKQLKLESIAALNCKNLALVVICQILLKLFLFFWKSTLFVSTFFLKSWILSCTFQQNDSYAAT